MRDRNVAVATDWNEFLTFLDQKKVRFYCLRILRNRLDLKFLAGSCTFLWRSRDRGQNKEGHEKVSKY